MNDYIEARIDATPCSEEITDLLAAFLADIGYESFVPDETGLTAYVKKESFSEPEILSAVESFPMKTNLKLEFKTVEGRDWNEEWEKNYFEPIVIEGKCVVHSTFHKNVPAAEYDIIIDPRMAFGTGHHSTTNLMISYILDLDLSGKRVIDMGTGTAILAILCAKRGAAETIGIEIDSFAYENALDNISLNGAENVAIENGDARLLKNREAFADIFIANINRNIIVDDIAEYSKALKPGATMLLSGFYTSDIPIVEKAAAAVGLQLRETRSDKDWACIRLQKI